MPVSFPGLGIELTVNRVAFTVGNLDIYWYAVFITIGALLALLYAFRADKIHQVPSDPFVDVLIVGLISGVLGARFFYVIFSLQDYDNFWDMINFRDGGLAIYGGIIFGVLGAYFMAKHKKMKFAPMLDIVSVSFLIGQGIGRWGNFTNQEAFGGNTTLPWGMISNSTTRYLQNAQAGLAEQGMIVDPYLPVHPCFLYESIWCLLGVLLLLLYRKHRKFDGEMFLMYIGWYGFGRFVIEGLRTDSLLIGGIRVSQLVALVCVAVALIVIYKKRKQLRVQTQVTKNTEVQTPLAKGDADLKSELNNRENLGLQKEKTDLETDKEIEKPLEEEGK